MSSRDNPLSRRQFLYREWERMYRQSMQNQPLRPNETLAQREARQESEFLTTRDRIRTQLELTPTMQSRRRRSLRIRRRNQTLPQSPPRPPVRSRLRSRSPGRSPTRTVSRSPTRTPMQRTRATSRSRSPVGAPRRRRRITRSPRSRSTSSSPIEALVTNQMGLSQYGTIGDDIIRHRVANALTEQDFPVPREAFDYESLENVPIDEDLFQDMDVIVFVTPNSESAFILRKEQLNSILQDPATTFYLCSGTVPENAFQIRLGDIYKRIPFKLVSGNGNYMVYGHALLLLFEYLLQRDRGLELGTNEQRQRWANAWPIVRFARDSRSFEGIGHTGPFRMVSLPAVETHTESGTHLNALDEEVNLFSADHCQRGSEKFIYKLSLYRNGPLVTRP